MTVDQHAQVASPFAKTRRKETKGNNLGLKKSRGVDNGKYHGKTFFLMAKHSFSQQNSFLTAKHSFSWQNIPSHSKTLFSHGKTFLLTAKLFSHGKTFFLTAKLFLMAKRSFVEYNSRSEEKTFSESEGKERYVSLVREIQRAPFAKHSPPLEIIQKVHTPKIVTFLPIHRPCTREYAFDSKHPPFLYEHTNFP